MPEITDQDMQRAIVRLMELMVEDGRTPEEAEYLVNNALTVWTQAHPTATPWRPYRCDRYRFALRRNDMGILEIRNEGMDDES